MRVTHAHLAVMRVLVACEFSGVVREAFARRGHDAWSCDLLESEQPNLFHIRGDALEAVTWGWDLLVAFPPCTDLSAIGAALWKQKQSDGRQAAALAFVAALMAAPVPRIAIENPVGRISTAIRKPDQIIEPWQFGHPWNKRTCLWLKELPPLEATKVVKPQGHWVDGGSSCKGRRCGDGRYSSRNPRRQTERQRTFPGIAAAMAAQWG